LSANTVLAQSEEDRVFGRGESYYDERN